MLDNDQCPGTDARGTDHPGAVRTGGVRVGRATLSGWALASVLVVAGFGTAMGATPVAVPRPVPVADTTDTTGTATAGLDPLALLPTAHPLGPAAVLPNLPTIAPAPDPGTATAAPAPAAGPVARGPTAQLRQAAFTTDAPDARAAVAIRTALAQIGLPYVWGGDGPTNGDSGFDCSGLTTFSYASAGVPLPRTAHTQYNAGPHVPNGVPLQPGDLVFYGTPARVHHVGMYLGAGRMVNAPTFGKPVQVAFYRYRGDDYLGATRPAAAAGSLTSGILPYVDPALIPAVPGPAPARIFPAPTAPLPAVLPQPGDTTLPPEQVTAAQAVAESDAAAVATGAAQPAAVVGLPPSAPAAVAPVPVPPASVPPASVPPASGAPVPVTTDVPTVTTSTVAPAVPATSTPPTGAATTPTTTTSTTTPSTTATSTTATSTTATSTTQAPAAPVTTPKTTPKTAVKATATTKAPAPKPATTTTQALVAPPTSAVKATTTAPKTSTKEVATTTAAKVTTEDETTTKKTATTTTGAEDTGTEDTGTKDTGTASGDSDDEGDSDD